MKIVDNIKDLRLELELLETSKRSLGFVPTMGAFHEGHISLFKNSIKENKHTAVSIFVNPTQFNEQSDFENYPKNNARDLEILEDLQHIDLVFLPKPEDLYLKSSSSISVNPGQKSELLCGMSRPGHFRGVLTIVLKLFNLFQADRAYFGTKDYQQFLLISEMVESFNLPIELRLVPTYRESDGLAMSSRNQHLNATDREEAPILFQSLEMGSLQIKKGENDTMKLIEMMMTNIIENSHFDIDYLSIVDPVSLEDLIEVHSKRPYLIAIAAYISGTRLIDNLLHLPQA